MEVRVLWPKTISKNGDEVVIFERAERLNAWEGS